MQKSRIEDFYAIGIISHILGYAISHTTTLFKINCIKVQKCQAHACRHRYSLELNKGGNPQTKLQLSDSTYFN